MTFYVTNQNFVILSLFLFGIALGVLYDAFSVKRIFIRTPQILLVIEDLIFSLLALISFLMIIFITNYGYVRWYEFFSLFCGFFIYKIFLSYFLVKASLFIIRFVIRVIGIVLFPFKNFVLMLFKGVCRIYRCIAELLYSYRIKRYSAKRTKQDCKLSQRGFRI